MCTAYTLEEVRRHWRLYVEMKTLPDKRIKAIREAFKAVAKSRPSKTLGNGARSAGPFMIHAFDAAAKLEDHYWKTGTTFFDDALDTAAMKLNPTLVYSLGGEGCKVHYGTDPVTPFHLSLAFNNSPHSVRPHDLVEVAKIQFKDWCTSFKASTSPTKPMNPVVRFIVGEATAVSRSLQLFVETGSPASSIPVAPWKSQLLVLSEGDLSSALRRDIEGIPPPLFNVIDTSNLVDHIGMYARRCFRRLSLLTMSRCFERPDRRDPNAFRIPPRECHVHRVTHIQREECHQRLHRSSVFGCHAHEHAHRCLSRGLRVRVHNTFQYARAHGLRDRLKADRHPIPSSYHMEVATDDRVRFIDLEASQSTACVRPCGAWDPSLRHVPSHVRGGGQPHMVSAKRCA